MQLASKDFDYFEGQDGSDLEMGIISAKNEKNDDLNKKINSTSNPAEHLVDQFKNNIQQAAVPVIHAKPHPVTLLPVYSTHSVAEVPNYNYTNYASNRRNKWHGSKPNRRQKVRRRRSQRSNKRRGRRNDKSYNYTSTYSRGRRSRPFDDKRGTRRMRRRSTRIK
jgi:hypothetical protein